MDEPLSPRIREYLATAQGKRVSLKDIRAHLKIEVGSPSDLNLRVQMTTSMVKQKLVYPSGNNDGWYKVVKQVQPVKVFGVNRKSRPPFPLTFPRDWETEQEMSFAESLVIREGDLISVGGVKSKGKTTFFLNLVKENVHLEPILMGNEYTVEVEGRVEPAPRFFNCMLRMANDDAESGFKWTDDEGNDKFQLLPVKEDYHVHVVPGKFNLIDWIDIDGGVAYEIGPVLHRLKDVIGGGVLAVALQKNDTSDKPRGGQYVRDYSDLEILLDGFGDNPDDILLTIKGAKEIKEGSRPIVGHTYAYTIWAGGTQIRNFREVKKCNRCFGSGKSKNNECDSCWGRGYQDV